MRYTSDDHTFVVCAYGESPYLEQCILSLEAQTVRTKIVIATSTPGKYISDIAGRHGLEVFVNPVREGIASDWNFALASASTPLATIAHQDDIYEPQYAETMLSRLNAARNPIIFSSNYAELRDGVKVRGNTLLNIKKILRLPMRFFPASVKARRLSLAFGDSICCPSVTYVKPVTDAFPFLQGYRASLDWQQWERLSRVSGSFTYSNRYLMCHRIHKDSETSHVIGGTGRKSEDYEMFLKFWPAPVARKLADFYAGAEKSNGN